MSKIFSYCAHRDQWRVVMTVGKGGYTAAVKNIYEVPPSDPLEEHNEAIESLHAIAQGMQDQRHEMDGLAQANSFLTSSNTAVMTQLTAAMWDMQEHMKKLSTKPKRKYCC